MNAKGATLADDSVEQHSRALRNAVLLGEKFLEFVDHQERAGELFGAAGALVSGDVLNAQLAEKVAAAAEFGIDPFEHAQAELAVAFYRNDPRVGQSAGCRAI